MSPRWWRRWGATPNRGLARHGGGGPPRPASGRTRSPSEKPPSVWAVALGQLRDPMNIMLDRGHRREPGDQPVLHRGHRRLPGRCSTWSSGHARSSRHAPASTPSPRCRFLRPRSSGTASSRSVPAVDARPRRHRAARSGRHRPGRWPHRAVGHARDPGGGADWRERTGRQGRADAVLDATSVSATAPTWRSRTRR